MHGIVKRMKEKILLAITVDQAKGAWTPEHEAREMTELIESCGGTVIETVFCKIMPPTASHLITSGKVKEIQEIIQQGNVDSVIVSHDLKGVQQRNLEEDFGVKTLDRTQLILDIFAKHATSLEGKMQVELAQLSYLLPRLVGSNDALSRQGGGIGTSGPGETKLEVDRRRVRERIAKLKKELAAVTQSRQIKRKKRQEHEIPTIALVGYTNAGKSTLLNALTQAGTLTHDGLFTTLDSLSRQAELPNNRKAVFSDTVGFMHDLPHGLIEAFKATLEEVEQADLLLHVIDISAPDYQHFFTAVNKVLKEIGVLEKPTILVCNKIDQLTEPKRLDEFISQGVKTIGVSALKGQNIQQLLLLVEDFFSSSEVAVDVKLPADRMDLVNLAHQHGKVREVKFLATGIRLKAHLPLPIAATIERAAR